MIDLNTKFGRFVKKRLKDEYFVWLITVDSTGTPQPRPVWFIWENDTVLIYSQAKAYKVGHIQHNPNVSLHFNSADPKGEQGLIMFTGTATIDTHALPANKHRAYLRKYKAGILGLKATPEQFAAEYAVAIRVTPTKVRGEE